MYKPKTSQTETKITTKYKTAQDITEKESEETNLEDDSDRTISEIEMVPAQFSFANQSPNISESKNRENAMIQQIINSQDIIALSSDCEIERLEPKKSADCLCKFRPPKKCGKNVLEDTEDTCDKANEGGLKKRYLSDLKAYLMLLNLSERDCRLRTHGLLKEAISKNQSMSFLNGKTSIPDCYFIHSFFEF